MIPLGSVGSFHAIVIVNILVQFGIRSVTTPGSVYLHNQRVILTNMYLIQVSVVLLHDLLVQSHHHCMLLLLLCS